MSRWCLSLSLLVVACGATTSPCGPTTGVVDSVVDGDTINLSSGERIRYLLADTPESTGGKNDCYGATATDYNRSLVQGKQVTLRYDAECKDRFNRLLAYVTVDGVEVNSKLVSEGYACVLYLPPDGQSRKEEFETLQSVAKTERRGMWGACQTVTCGN